MPALDVLKTYGFLLLFADSKEQRLWGHGRVEEGEETRRKGLHVERRGPQWSRPRAQKRTNCSGSPLCSVHPHALHCSVGSAPQPPLLTTLNQKPLSGFKFSYFHLNLQRGRGIHQVSRAGIEEGGPQTIWVLMTAENSLRPKEMHRSCKMKRWCLKIQENLWHQLLDLGFSGSGQDTARDTGLGIPVDPLRTSHSRLKFLKT